MTVYQMRKLATEYSQAAEECNRRGFKTIAAINRGMADYYLARSTVNKTGNGDVNSDTD